MKSYLGNVYRHLAIFYGHTAVYQSSESNVIPLGYPVAGHFNTKLNMDMEWKKRERESEVSDFEMS